MHKANEVAHDPSSLRYAIETEAPGWNTPRTVALTSSIAVGYAAFYAAARERPDAATVLRCGDMVLSRWAPIAD